jgi:hypothetical protein
MNDIDLLKQFRSDISQYVIGGDDNSVMGNTEMQRCLKDLSSSRVEKLRKNHLYIIDESHYGSDSNQTLDKFLKQVLGIDLSNPLKALEDNNLYFLSVSATPMAELLTKETSDIPKTKVILNNSQGYVGVRDMFEQQRVYPSTTFKTLANLNSFMDKVRAIGKGYTIVRGTDKNLNDLIRHLKKYEPKWKLEVFDAANNGTEGRDINDILNIKPNSPTVILIKGMLRAGKRMDCIHVKMVWDTPSSKSDTVAQSLMGRCCGYGKPTDIQIYCDVKSAKQYRDWVENEFEDFLGNAKNVTTKGSISSNEYRFWPLPKEEFSEDNKNPVKWMTLTREELLELECKEGNWVEWVEKSKQTSSAPRYLLTHPEIGKVSKVREWSLYQDCYRYVEKSTTLPIQTYGGVVSHGDRGNSYYVHEYLNHSTVSILSKNGRRSSQLIEEDLDTITLKADLLFTKDNRLIDMRLKAFKVIKREVVKAKVSEKSIYKP